MNQSLQRGLECHRSGRVVEARDFYKRALDEEPTSFQAHHLLGVAFHHLGECSTAIVHLDRAVELNPSASQVHSNRAETLRSLGRFEESESAARRACELDPNNAAAHHNLGVILLRRRRSSEAETILRHALSIQKRSQTMAALGDALRHCGRLRDAIEQYEQAVVLDGANAAARGNLAALYVQFGRHEEALSHAKAAVEIAPRNADAHLRLGRLLLELGRINEAMDAFAAGLELGPDHPKLCLYNGYAWLRVGKLMEAIRWAERALRLDPTLLEAKCLGAEVQLEAGDIENAIRTYRGVVEEQPDSRGAQVGLSKALFEQGDVIAASSILKAQISRFPESAGLHSSLGDILMKAGDLETAVESFTTSVKLNPRCVAGYAGLGTTLRGKIAEEIVRRIEEMLDATWLTDAQRASLRFALAQIYDGKGDYDRAGDQLALANVLQRRSFVERDRDYHPCVHRRQVDHVCEIFNEAYFRRTAGFGDRSERPVFIVGMPRSGTTLTEQIIASHPQAYGAGERDFVQKSMLVAVGLRTASPLDDVSALTQNEIQAAAKWQLEQLDRLDGGKAIRVVDKMPDNYLSLGWIATLFPNARIIHCRRDVRDTALSCWMTNFARIPWANDLEHLAERINDYHRVMDHYRRTLPIPMLEVDYEDTVADNEAATRRLLDWVGLPWDDRCLEFHKTDRLVRTASVAQVRQPIYTRSVARWTRYESHLQPLLLRLHAP